MSDMCGISSVAAIVVDGVIDGLKSIGMLCRPFGTWGAVVICVIDGLTSIVRLCRPFGTLCYDSPKGTAYHRIGFQSNYLKNVN